MSQTNRMYRVLVSRIRQDGECVRTKIVQVKARNADDAERIALDIRNWSTAEVLNA